jgi:hypothetical protein
VPKVGRKGAKQAKKYVKCHMSITSVSAIRSIAERVQTDGSSQRNFADRRLPSAAVRAQRCR